MSQRMSVQCFCFRRLGQAFEHDADCPERPETIQIKGTELSVGPYSFQIRIDPLLPIGIVRLIDMQTGNGVEYNERTGQLTKVTVLSAPLGGRSDT